MAITRNREKSYGKGLTALSLFFFLCIFSFKGFAQDSLKTRKIVIASGTGALWAGSMFVLNEQWYADYPKSSFHSFKDGKQWLQMDKVGHVMTTNYVSQVCYNGLKWGGYSENQSIWIGTGISWGYLLGVEIFDGFSEEWGFSTGDFVANTIGSSVFVGQQLFWKEQRLRFKYSFHNTKYADFRPETLGSSTLESALKDYNGQTYWLSGNIHSFLRTDSNFPKWLNVAVGYGGEGMTGGIANPEINSEGVAIPNFERERQLYLSFDIDLHRIESDKTWFNLLKNTFGFIKVPAPTIEFNQNGSVNWYFFYF